MIIEVALGVVLGVVLLAYWRELIALGALAVALGIASVVLLVFGLFLYEALQAAKQTPLWHAANSTMALIGGLLANLFFAFAIGQVLEGRTSLRGRQAYVLGALFYILTMASTMLTTYAVVAYLETENTRILLYLVAVVAAWSVLVADTLRRNNQERHRAKSKESTNVA